MPHTGVYFVNVLVDGIPYLGMANIGHNPTFNFKDKLELEVHIFNFDEDIYDNQNPAMFEAWPQGVVDITVELSELLGAETNIYSNIDGDPIIAAVPSRDDLAPGQPLKLVFDLNHVHFFDEDTEKIINENSDRAQAKSDDDLDI